MSTPPTASGLAHNGNLTNYEDLRKELFTHDLRHLNTDSDSELILNVFAHEFAKARQAGTTPRGTSSRR